MDEILTNLKECEALLRGVEEKFWADTLLDIIIGWDTKPVNVTLDKILSMYGGMGSINDLIISRHNGHAVDCTTEEKVNNNFNKLRAALYDQTVREKKEVRD